MVAGRTDGRTDIRRVTDTFVKYASANGSDQKVARSSANNIFFTCITVSSEVTFVSMLNRLPPNEPYMGRTAPLTSKRCILYIYSTNIGTEYFKHALYSPFFFLFKMQFVS